MKTSSRLYATAICAGALVAGSQACQSAKPVNPSLSPGEGYAQVTGGRIWYRVTGTGKGTPLIVIHGGPGVASYYLKPLASLGDERPVIFYDQLGSGKSDHPKDTALWKTDRFVEELEALRRTLKLKEVHLLGHSWGANVAVEYMLKYPGIVRSAVLSGASLSLPRWTKDADSLRRTMPDSIQRVISTEERAGTTQSPEYQSAVIAFYTKYMSRRLPWGPDMDSTAMTQNMGVYGYMWGPSEFTPTGTLRNYDITPRLREIKSPVMFTIGEFDEVLPETARYYQSQLPGSQLRIIRGAAHISMQDEPGEYIAAVRGFLREVEAKDIR